MKTWSEKILIYKILLEDTVQKVWTPSDSSKICVGEVMPVIMRRQNLWDWRMQQSWLHKFLTHQNRTVFLRNLRSLEVYESDRAIWFGWARKIAERIFMRKCFVNNYDILSNDWNLSNVKLIRIRYINRTMKTLRESVSMLLLRSTPVELVFNLVPCCQQNLRTHRHKLNDYWHWC